MERQLSVLDSDIATVISQLTPDEQTAQSVSPVPPQDFDSVPSSSEVCLPPSSYDVRG